ncbi:MAG: PqqD family protein [Eubacteriales bacterium]|nr:PqqD family protein [Eubacteriales bacterium]
MKSKKNYLDYIPVKNEEFEWETTDENRIVINRTNNGWMERVTQVLLKRPKVTRIELEEYGTFIWPLIDGERSVYDIAQLVKAEFKDKAEPLYDRLAAYFKSMEENKLVKMK